MALVARGLCVVFLALAPEVARAQTSADFDKERALRDWRLLSESIVSARVESVSEFYLSRDSAPLALSGKHVLKNTVSRNGRAFFYDIEDYDLKERDTRLYLSNEKYTAVLKKPKGEKDWLLVSWQSKSADDRNPTRPYKQIPLPWLTCGNVWLPDWIADGSFVITRSERLPDEVVRVHFACDLSRRVAKDVPDHITSGHIDFERSHSYRPVGYEYKYKSALSEGIQRGVLEYDSVGDIPMLKTVTEDFPKRRHPSGLMISSQQKHRYKTEYQAPVDERAFRLSYYGLPEPHGVVWPRDPNYFLWIVFAAAWAIVTGMLLRSICKEFGLRQGAKQPTRVQTPKSA